MTHTEEVSAIVDALQALGKIENPSARIKDVCEQLKACLVELGYRVRRDPVSKGYLFVPVSARKERLSA